MKEEGKMQLSSRLLNFMAAASISTPIHAEENIKKPEQVQQCKILTHH
jgi:hypothetical protein